MKKKIALLIAFLSLICMTALTGCSEATVYEEGDAAKTYIDKTDAAFQEVFALTQTEDINQKISYYREIEDETYLNLYQAWRNTLPDLGDYVGIKDKKVYESAESGTYVKSYTCEIVYEFSKHDLTTKISYNSDETVASMSMEASYSFAEKMSKALLNTALGMGTVFVVLILICLVISCFGLVRSISDKSAAKKAATAAAVTTATTDVTSLPEESAAEQTDDDELAVVISAAIAAYEAETGSSTDGLVVRSIRRVNNSKWRNA